MEFPVRRILWRNVSRAFRLTTLKGTCLVSALIGHWLNLDGQASTSTTYLQFDSIDNPRVYSSHAQWFLAARIRLFGPGCSGQAIRPRSHDKK